MDVKHHVYNVLGVCCSVESGFPLRQFSVSINITVPQGFINLPVPDKSCGFCGRHVKHRVYYLTQQLEHLITTVLLTEPLQFANYEIVNSARLIQLTSMSGRSLLI